MKLKSTLALAATVLLVGCASDRSILGHRPTLTGQVRLDLTPDSDISTWRRKYYSSTSDDLRKFYRNEIIRRLMRLDDESFEIWSQKLYGARALSSSIADFATGLIGAFAAASGASTAQDLGLAVAGVSGARSAADNDIFLEKSAGALISKMKEDRAKVDTQITQYLSTDTTNYSLEQGLRDIIRYYDAGTLASASESLQADTKVAQQGAQAVVEQIKGDTVVAPAEIAKSKIQPQLPARTPEEQVSQPDIQKAVDKAHAADAIDATAALAENAALDLQLALAPAKPDYEAIMMAGGATPADFARLGTTKAAFATFVREKAKANDTTAIQAMASAAQAQLPHPGR